MLNETVFLYLACSFYVLSFIFTYLAGAKDSNRWVIIFAACGLLVHALGLASRWERVGHGPFINLYEILSSNLWSLMLAYLIFMIWVRHQRSIGRYLVPLLAMLMLWLLLTPPRDTYLPATYNTVWLYFHVLSGKFFLGLLMLATAMALVELPRPQADSRFATLPASESLSYRLLAFAFCFESLMLVFGAIWAQDAWGRYWAWDPLETWAFLTWASVIFVLHWRLSSSRRTVYAALVAGCFVLAFLTFFGVPFISTAPHKGMI